MAVTKCIKRNEAVDVVETAVTTEGIAIEAQDHGDRMVLLLTASAACNATIVAGDAEVWGGLEDLTIKFTAAGSKAVCLDTARFKFVSGDNKGKIVVKANAADSLKATLLIGC
ncbi:MAG: hypothetical protein IJY05_03175 [Clostridia bacterium]|nr:hypothetical protein [Clostridia bacterium]